MTDVLPLVPLEDDLTRFHWDGARDGRLLIQRCDDCLVYQHWPNTICRQCLGTALSPAEMSGSGTVYTFTVGVQAFHPYFADKLPFILAVIELAEQPGLRMVTNLVECDPDDIRCGMPVEVVFHELTDGVVLPQFRPTARAGDHGSAT
jgi:uncharacterized OB-fold protein